MQMNLQLKDKGFVFAIILWEPTRQARIIRKGISDGGYDNCIILFTSSLAIDIGDSGAPVFVLTEGEWLHKGTKYALRNEVLLRL